MRLLTISMAAPLALGLLAAAPVPNAHKWIEAPTYAEVAAVYPAAAKAARIAGRAELTCTVRLGGKLDDCAVLAETPGGYGFGAAARRLVNRFRAANAHAGDELRIPVAFVPEMIDGVPFVASNVDWLALPSVADFQATFPKTENGVNEVKVAMTCGVVAGGQLADCDLASEQPAGQGYGAGALALAPKLRVGLVTPEGLPTVGAKVRVQFHYELTPEPAPKS